MKTKLIALFCACFLLLNVVDMVVPRSEAKIFDNVIRLHVLAESDSYEDQQIKLAVRDAVLNECPYLFDKNGDIAAASETVEQSLPYIEKIANRVLDEQGASYRAKAEWGYEEYPTRIYENLSLPAGKYRSLRINLGSAEGQNWWCVLFPPLCNNASTDITASGVNGRDTSVFSNRKYIFRFKLLELFGD